MFKDGHAFPGKAVSLLPESYREEGLRIIKETNETLSAYIQGQALVCIFVGAFTFIGYLIIDLPYAFVLGIIAAFTNIIPNLGPFIGANTSCYCRTVRISDASLIRNYYRNNCTTV